MTGRSSPQEVERRQHRRATIKTTISFVSDSNFYTGFTGDISEGGLFVATHQVAAQHTVFELEFTLPDDQAPIKVQGEVRWVREYNPSSDGAPGMGLQFLNLSDLDRQRILQFVNQRETIFYED